MKTNDTLLVETLNYLKGKIENRKLKVAFILGSGLSNLDIKLEDTLEIPYSDIPNFPESSVPGHSGSMLIGKFGKIDCIFFKGRFHYYEGHSLETLRLPIRILYKLGVKNLVVTNAAGGISPDFAPGDFMIILDHINLMGMNPLIGLTPGSIKTRFIDMTNAYDPSLVKLAETVALELKIPIKRGVYAAMSGPSYETPSEIRMLRTFGADAVGMSTVPEVIMANALGMKTLGLSYISNLATGIQSKALNHQEVLDTAEKVKILFSKFSNGILTQLEKRLDEKKNLEPQATTN